MLPPHRGTASLQKLRPNDLHAVTTLKYRTWQSKRRVQGRSTSCPASIIQAAAAEALNGKTGSHSRPIRSFQQRRDFVVGALNRIDGIPAARPRAPYTLTSCAGLITKMVPTAELSRAIRRSPIKRAPVIATANDAPV